MSGPFVSIIIYIECQRSGLAHGKTARPNPIRTATDGQCDHFFCSPYPFDIRCVLRPTSSNTFFRDHPQPQRSTSGSRGTFTATYMVIALHPMQQPAGMASSASSDASGSAATEHFLVYGYKVCAYECKWCLNVAQQTGSRTISPACRLTPAGSPPCVFCLAGCAMQQALQVSFNPYAHQSFTCCCPQSPP
jgi:hypothetical protein